MDPLILKIVGFYRGWYAWECANASFEQGKFVLIDDLCQSKEIMFYFSSKSQVEGCLAEIIREVSQRDERSFPRYDYTFKKLTQSLSYLVSISNDNKRVSKEQVESRGTKWMSVSTKELDEMKAEADAIKKEALNIDENLLSEYFTKTIPSEYVPALLSRKAVEATDMVYREIPDLVPFTFHTKKYESTLPWRNLVTHDNNEFELLVNTHACHKYTPAIINCLAIHEVCGHMLHLQQLLHNQDIQNRSPHLLCISIHTHDSYLAEGIAQLLSEFVISRIIKKDTALKAAFKHFLLYYAVRHKNLTDLICDQVTSQEAANLHCNLLGGDMSAVRGLYEIMLKDPFFCSQVLNYHTAYLALKPLLKLSNEKFIHCLRQLMADFFTFSQLDEFVSKALRAEE